MSNYFESKNIVKEVKTEFLRGKLFTFKPFPLGNREKIKEDRRPERGPAREGGKHLQTTLTSHTIASLNQKQP